MNGRSNAEIFYAVMHAASRKGYEWDQNRDFVAVRYGRILYQRHIPIIFRSSLLHALFGDEYRIHAHAMLDLYLDGKNPLEYLDYHIHKPIE